MLKTLAERGREGVWLAPDFLVHPSPSEGVNLLEQCTKMHVHTGNCNWHMEAFPCCKLNVRQLVICAAHHVCLESTSFLGTIKIIWGT